MNETMPGSGPAARGTAARGLGAAAACPGPGG